MSDTQETDKLLVTILDRRGVLDDITAPEEWVKLCRKLEHQRNHAMKQAEFWRAQYAKLYARNSFEYDQQIKANKFDWE